MKSKVFSMSIGGLAVAGIVCTALLISLAPRSEAAVYWGGGSGNWTDDNWYDSASGGNKVTPGETEERYIIGDGDDVTLSSAGQTSGHVKVGGSSGTPTFNMTGGDLNPSSRIILGNGAGETDVHSESEFNMTGGTIDYADFLFGKEGQTDTGSASATTTVNFGSTDSGSAPVLKLNRYYDAGRGRSTAPTYAESYWSGHGTIEAQDRGAENYEAWLELGRGNPDGTELLEVEGGNLNLSFENGGRLGSWTSANTSDAYTIRYVLDGTGVSTLDLGGGPVEFGPESGDNTTVFDLDTISGYTHDVGMEYTILTTTGDFTNYGEFANVSDGDTLTVNGNEFTADYDTSGTNSTFSITAVPEPSSLMLLGLAGLLLMRRRRL